MVPATELDTGPLRIMVVEDDPLVRLVLAENLRDAGFFAIESANAAEALAYIGAASPVDLVISDVRMPGPLDGVALARQLKSTHPLLPVILTSSDFPSWNITDSWSFIRKPYHPAQVIAEVIKTLGLRQSNET